MQIKGFVIGLFLYVFILLYSVKMSMEIIFFYHFNLQIYKKGSGLMSNLDNGRAAIKEFMKENGITMDDLATAYGHTRVRMQQILDGHWSGPKANRTILEIIRDYRIR